jgi:hypothetical protein
MKVNRPANVEIGKTEAGVDEAQHYEADINDSELGSALLQSFLARYGAIHKTLPSAAPRFGSILEKFFSTTNSQLLNQLGRKYEGP